MDRYYGKLLLHGTLKTRKKYKCAWLTKTVGHGRAIQAHWCAWTRPGCRLASLYRCTAAVAPSACSRSGCSGRPCPRLTPAGRAGEATRRWPSPLPGALCIAALAARWSGSTLAAEERGGASASQRAGGLTAHTEICQMYSIKFIIFIMLTVRTCYFKYFHSTFLTVIFPPSLYICIQT